MFSLRRWAGVIAVALLLLVVAAPAAIAVSPAELGSTRPDERVLMMPMFSVVPAALSWKPGWTASSRIGLMPG